MKLRQGWFLLLSAFFALFFFGCSEEEAAYAPPEEERLVVYTSHKEEVYDPIIREFEARTGIWVELVTGGSNELLQQLDQESEAPVADIMFGGGVESLEAYKDCFQCVTCEEAEAIEPGLRASDDRWTPFSRLPVVLIYNTKLVRPGEVTGWGDLLLDQWRGRIAMADPTVSGSSYTAVLTMMQALPGEEEVVSRLIQNLDGKLLPSSTDVPEQVADGTLPVGVTLEETALKWIARGADIGIIYPAEGTSAVPDGCAVVADCPHQENAEAFLNFVLSRDVQSHMARTAFRWPVRVDVEETEDMPLQEKLDLLDYDILWAAEWKPELLELWNRETREAQP